MSNNKQKVGMYGETPKVQIGNITICEMNTLEDDSVGESIWMEDISTGEGSEFHKKDLEPILQEFFNKNF